jgi:hypothetical protein
LYERLDRPERCRTEQPELRAIGAIGAAGAAGKAACHFSEELATSDVGRVDPAELVRRSPAPPVEAFDATLPVRTGR